jgi:cytochrome c oxidase subunit 2
VRQKRILIVSRYSLFDQGLRAGLSRRPDVEVVGVCRDLEEAYAQAHTLRPDVLLVIAEPEAVSGSTIRLLEEVSPSIIRISPTDGSMQVYRREQVDEATLDDLMLAIQMTTIQWGATDQPQEPESPQVVPTGEEHPTSRRRTNTMKHYIAVAVLVAIAAVLVAVGLGSIQLLPPLASAEGVLVDGLLGLHIKIIAFLFALIMVFMVYSIFAFRRKPGETGDGAHVRGNSRLEIVWTVVPLGVVLYLGVLGTQLLSEIVAPEPDELVVEVTGQQFAWRFDYPDYDISTPVLHLPRGRQVLLKLTAVDVIHSFWVPEFRIKQDAVPGMVTTLRITPTELGEYKLRCAELCGTGHAYMLADVKVVEPADFEAWVASETAASELAGAAGGAQLAELQGCAGCHSVDGSQLVGPTWLDLYGSERTFADGTTAVADEDYIRNSIIEANAQVVAGFPPNVMPQTYGDALTAEEIDGLIAYIKSLGN